MERWWRTKVGDHAQTGRNSRENKGRGMIRVGENERNWEGKFANRLQEQIRGDLLGKCARRKQERWREGGREGGSEGGRGWGGRKFMSMRPDDPETGEAQAHKNALYTPTATPQF